MACLSLVAAPLAHAQTATAKLAVITSLSGDEALYGRSFLDSVRLAVEEANAQPNGPRVELQVHDDQSTEAGARLAATQVGSSDALAAVGPVASFLALSAGPALSQSGIATIVSTAGSDLVTRNATTFQTIYKNSDLGESLASYLRYALNGKRAAVIFIDNGYGHTFADGFKRGAERLGLPTTYHSFKTPAERDEATRLVAADPDKPAVALAMLDGDAGPVITTLRRSGVTAPILGPGALGDQSFAASFKDLPEERREPGFFTRNFYVGTPVLLDSANAETLAFAERYRRRFGQEAAISWLSVQAYDGARLAIDAVRAAAQSNTATDLGTRRELVRSNLISRNGPATALAGLTGPLWFTADRSRHMPIRVGRFTEGEFESAPIQLVPVAHPSAAEISAGTVVEIGAGQYARRQQVVYAGIYLNEIPRLDVAQSTFTADIYVWLRFVRGIATSEADPTQIEFPDLVRGTFDEKRPLRQRDLDDGTTYRVWRLRGDFKNDFQLQRYPADHQTLSIRFFNARAASDRLVYVLDRSAFDDEPTHTPSRPSATDRFHSAVAPAAFRNLTQWEAIRVRERRDTLVTDSTLGEPGLVGVERLSELSGFDLEVEIQRRISTTLVKTLLPIGLMTLIMFATLFFPPGLAAAKVTVAITAGLSGAVLLASINAQLGNVGYVIAVEYGFYVFFGLCLMCIIAVLTGEHLRLANRSTVVVDRMARLLFVTTLIATGITAWLVVARWN